MSTNRKIVFANKFYYHIYNRGFERRVIFSNTREYQRALETINYYRFEKHPMRFSRFLDQPAKDRQSILKEIDNDSNKLVEIISFCLMPNHFHFELQQLKDKGISKFISDFTNSYTKYFNIHHHRDSNLLQGTFKAVVVESNEQLLHLSRYIHLNPIISSLVRAGRPEDYLWSSYKEYFKCPDRTIVDPRIVLEQFKTPRGYKKFVNDHKQRARELEIIKHLSLG